MKIFKIWYEVRHYVQQLSAGSIMRRAKQRNLDTDILFKGAWVSTVIALYIVLPLVAVLFLVYSITGSIILGGVAGFIVHIATLLSLTRVSEYLTSLLEA
jgi:hypothetical protein